MQHFAKKKCNIIYNPKQKLQRSVGEVDVT